jgi:arylsulfatase A-like enzyme
LQNYYFNCIRDCDGHLVRLLEEVKANGLDGSTIVVFTADHGELGGAHQMRGKGANAYKEQQHLPLMIVIPPIPAAEARRRCPPRSISRALCLPLQASRLRKSLVQPTACRDAICPDS